MGSNSCGCFGGVVRVVNGAVFGGGVGGGVGFGAVSGGVDVG